MPPSTSHRTKRAFLSTNQTSLDTFFPSQSPTDPPSPSALPTSRDVRSPALPTAVQSNLLTVGMRVRKSVPEGYKTHKMGFHDVRHATIRLEEPSAPPPSRPAELQPFCGLMKVGGYATQDGRAEYPALGADAFAEQDSNEDPLAFPFSSQESTASDASAWSTSSIPARDPVLQPSFGNGNSAPTRRAPKRDLDLDEDSSFSTSFLTDSPHAHRPIALPKPRRRSPRLASRQTTLTNMMLPPLTVPDFEEATFFKAEDWKDGPMDIENEL